MAIDTKVTVKIDGDASGFLKAKAQMERENERARQKEDVALAKALAAQGKLTEETFKTAKAQGQVGDAAGKAVDFVGNKVKALGSSLVSGAFAGLFAGLAGGSIGSIIQKLFAPPTPQEQQALATAMSRNEAGLFSIGHAAEFAAKALKKMGEEETAALEAAERHSRFLNVQGLVGKYSGGARAQRFQQALDDIRGKPGSPGASNVLEAAEQAKAIVDAMGAAGITLKSKDIYGIADELKVGLDVANAVYDEISVKQTVAKEKVKRARAASKAVDKELLEWFKDQVAPTDTSAGRKILDEQGRQRALIGEDQAARQAAMMEDFERSEAARAQGAQGWFSKGLASYNEKSPLEQLFGGPPEVVDAYKEAFTGLAGAAGEAYEAIVTGSGSAGAAFKKFLADSLLGLGKKSAVEALYEAALALASLARGDLVGAAAHGKAAAAHAAVAVVAGAAAAGLGAGSGGGSSASAGGGGGGYGGSSSGGSNGPVNETHNHFYAHPQANSSPTDRQRYAQELASDANGGGGYGVSRG